MARKGGAGGASGASGVTYTSEVMRHVNEQTMAADSTTEVAEAISTPGYSEVGQSGCLIIAAQVSPNPLGTGYFFPTLQNQWRTQLLTGDKTVTPAFVGPTDVSFFAQGIRTLIFVTSGGAIADWPMPLVISMPVPIIVMPKFTIMHGMAVNDANFASKVIYTEIYYRTVRLTPLAYTGLLLQQQRVS